jgi:2-dehydropantoate 2-reductase
MEPVYVVGAGGIGCAVGYFLRRAGLEVAFVEADPAKVSWGRAHGVRVDRRPPLPAPFLHFADWSPSAGAVILLCTKCFDNPTVLARTPAAATLIPVQNGFDDRLDGRGGGLEGVASFISECEPHRSHTRITRGGGLHLGPRRRSEGGAGAAEHPLARRIAEALRRHSPFRVREVADILPFKYAKLMYNAAIGPLAAVAGLDNGQLLGIPAVRTLFFRLLRENYAILKRAGVRLGRVGPFHPDTVDAILRRPRLARALAVFFRLTLRRTYCSMHGDLPAGRTEVDHYNGHLVRLAGDGPCPLNRRVLALVRRLEREWQRPHVGLLEGLTT